MARWINVDGSYRQISHWDDSGFPFGLYMDEYGKMDERSLPLHWHQTLEFDLVLAGSVELWVDDRPINLDAGDAVFINSNTLHGGKQTSASEDAVVCAVCFSPEMLSGNVRDTVYQKFFSPVFGKTPCGFRIDRSSSEGGVICEILHRLSMLNRDDFGYELLAISAISELWFHALLYIKAIDFDLQMGIATSSRMGKIMKTLLIYVQENYAKGISVDQLSSCAHISRSECFRCFKEFTGKAPLEYVNDYRLSQAEHLLRTTSLSMLDISLACGFSGQSYFGEQFKARYGIPPAKYRKAFSNPAQ